MRLHVVRGPSECSSACFTVRLLTCCRPAFSADTLPFFTARLGTNTGATHVAPRSASQHHALLKKSGLVPVAPSGHHDLVEQLVSADALYSLAMLALELPDVPFHAFLSTCATTALHHVISHRRARFTQAASVEPLPTPTVSALGDVLPTSYQDAYAHHVRQDWLAEALTIQDDRDHDMEHAGNLFDTAKVDLCLHCLRHGFTDTPMSKQTLATCTVFRLLHAQPGTRRIARRASHAYGAHHSIAQHSVPSIAQRA